MIVPTGCQGILLDFNRSEGVHYFAFEADGYLSLTRACRIAYIEVNRLDLC
jgi:hypothetical protein